MKLITFRFFWLIEYIRDGLIIIFDFNEINIHFFLNTFIITFWFFYIFENFFVIVIIWEFILGVL